jgi:anti-sigma factor ChrR (cupin superfamily)
MQKVKEYYSAILVGVFGDNQGVYSEGDFPLSKNICQKCGETKPITSPEDCPVMKSDEKIQMLVSMHKAG